FFSENINPERLREKKIREKIEWLSSETAVKYNVLNNFHFKFFKTRALPDSDIFSRKIFEKYEEEGSTYTREDEEEDRRMLLDRKEEQTNTKRFAKKTWGEMYQEVDDALRQVGFNEEGLGNLSDADFYRQNIDRVYSAYKSLRRKGYSRPDLAG